MHNNYILLNSDYCSEEWWTDKNAKELFLELLFRTNKQPSKFRGVDLEAGQCVVGRRVLASALGLGENAVRGALDRLEGYGLITREATTRFSVVTINNYEEFFPDLNPHTTRNATTANELLYNYISNIDTRSVVDGELVLLHLQPTEREKVKIELAGGSDEILDALLTSVEGTMLKQGSQPLQGPAALLRIKAWHGTFQREQGLPFASYCIQKKTQGSSNGDVAQQLLDELSAAGLDQ